MWEFTEQGRMGKAKSDGGNSQKRNTTSHVQVLGWGTDTLSGALPSMQLFFDSTRLLFNCGEGLQRLSTDSHVRSRSLPRVSVDPLCRPSLVCCAASRILSLFAPAVASWRLFNHNAKSARLGARVRCELRWPAARI